MKRGSFETKQATAIDIKAPGAVSTFRSTGADDSTIGITFGAEATGASAPASSIGSSSFNFGRKDAQTETKPSGGFTFGVNASPSSGFTFGGTAVAIESASSQAGKPETPLKEQSAAAKAAAKIFDEMDTEKTERLPSYRFESLLDGLGEGFHGEKLRRQLDQIDPDNSGLISKSRFIASYVKLVEGSTSKDEGDHDGSV